MTDPIKMVVAGADPVATDQDHPDYAIDMNEGATEDGTPVASEFDNERGTAS